MPTKSQSNSVLEEYNAQSLKLFHIMDDEGKIINKKWDLSLADDEILQAFKFMQFVRLADQMAVSYQRQGRMYTYPPNFGQEAIATAVGFLAQKEDWIVPAFREMAAWLKKGAQLKDIFLYWGGDEDGSKFSGAPNILPSSVPIASQLTHAVGIGYALKYKKQKGVVYTFVGDGGTSEGDFHESLNFAAVWKTPVVFIIQNNQYAISVPVSRQTVSKNLAVKAVAYGMDGIQVDGNDYLAMHKALSEAAQHAASGKGPVLIEAVTFRRGAHTTSDDPSLYRTQEEEENWALKDPVNRLRKHLIAKKLWDEKDEPALLEEYKKEIEAQFTAYEDYPAYKLENVFKHHYEEMPDDLKKQQVEYEKFLNWEKS